MIDIFTFNTMNTTLIIVLLTVIFLSRKKFNRLYFKLYRLFKYPKKIRKALELCSRGRFSDFKKHMIQYNIDPNLKEINNVPLIILAINHNGAPEQNSEEHDNVKFIEFLIQKGAKVNVVDKLQKTPFFNAIYWGDVRAARILFQHGANPNTITKKIIFSPLSASLFKQNIECIIFLLLQCKADQKTALEILSQTNMMSNSQIQDCKSMLNRLTLLAIYNQTFQNWEISNPKLKYIQSLRKKQLFEILEYL